MDKERIDHFKQVLEELLEELKTGLDSGRDMKDVVSLDDSIGGLARADALQAQEISLGLKAGMRQRYEMVRRALDATANGSYGVCVGCKRSIAEERLEAIPEAPLCVDCSA